MWGGLDSGDLLMSCGGSPCLRFGDSSHTSGVMRAVTTGLHTACERAACAAELPSLGALLV